MEYLSVFLHQYLLLLELQDGLLIFLSKEKIIKLLDLSQITLDHNNNSLLILSKGLNFEKLYNNLLIKFNHLKRF